ncbi:unnamed protein product [Prorocentrum cordatum]|uniref:Uncharacterized protein n=1 Tax=Prorocentrum cordatum TaxID=2364126 RepID=A0ABN9XTH9_9DINO|nr:unnamed protein product [Polarella glacialis]
MEALAGADDAGLRRQWRCGGASAVLLCYAPRVRPAGHGRARKLTRRRAWFCPGSRIQRGLQCCSCDKGHMYKYWRGYVESPSGNGQGGFTKRVDTGCPASEIFMLNKSFGVHDQWAQRWACRLYAHRASFLGEAQILRALEPEVATETLEQSLESAWVRHQMWQRSLEREGARAALASSLLELPLESFLQSCASWYRPLMKERRLRAWRASGDRMDIVCVDGNAKLYRRSCGAPCAEAVYHDALDLHLVRGCPESPLQKGVLCRRHQELADRPALAGEVEAHRVRAPLSAMAYLDVEVRMTGFANWQPACTVPDSTVQAYFAKNAEQAIQERKRRRQERRELRRQPLRLVLGDWASGYAKDKCSCKTHKESVSAIRAAERSAGFLAAVSESGIVGALEEVITAETLSQRYCFLADVASAVPELKTLVHDDACRVRLFAKGRAEGAAPGSLAVRLGQFRYVVDRPHSKGHVDATCKAECFPDVPANAAALGDFPTPICESVNAQLSPLAHTVHHMGRWVCDFIVGECVDVHNELRAQEAARGAARAARKAARLDRALPPRPVPAEIPAAGSAPAGAPAGAGRAAAAGAAPDAAQAIIARRRLLPVWAAALADGEKFFECQGYFKGHPGNTMAFACPGARVIFGKDTAAGVAVCAGPAQRGCNADDAQRLLRAIPERLRDQLTAYLAPALSFDVLHMGAVFDLRPLALTWPALEEALAAQPLLQNQGFPRFHGGDLNARLDALCRRPGVVARRPPPPVRPD